MSNSTANATTCSAILDQKCADGSNSIGGITGMPIPTDESVFAVKRVNNTMEGMKACCRDRSVSVYDECTIWCQATTQDAIWFIGNSTEDDKSVAVSDYFTSCLSDHGADFGIATAYYSAAMPGTQPPTLAGLGVFALAVSGLIVTMG